MTLPDPTKSEPMKVGDVSYQLRSDYMGLGPFVIERLEVVAVCDSRDEARQWMIDNQGGERLG